MHFVLLPLFHVSHFYSTLSYSYRWKGQPIPLIGGAACHGKLVALNVNLTHCCIATNLLWPLLCYGFYLFSAAKCQFISTRSSKQVSRTWLCVVLTTDCSMPGEFTTTTVTAAADDDTHVRADLRIEWALPAWWPLTSCAIFQSVHEKWFSEKSENNNHAPACTLTSTRWFLQFLLPRSCCCKPN